MQGIEDGGSLLIRAMPRS